MFGFNSGSVHTPSFSTMASQLGLVAANAVQAQLALCLLARSPLGGVGRYRSLLTEGCGSPNSGTRPFSDARAELLPIRVELAVPFFETYLCSYDRDVATSAREIAAGSLSALIFLHGAGWSDAPIIPNLCAGLTAAHRTCLIHLVESALNFFEC